jgi:hypothetical protein
MSFSVVTDVTRYFLNLKWDLNHGKDANKLCLWHQNELAGSIDVIPKC